MFEAANTLIVSSCKQFLQVHAVCICAKKTERRDKGGEDA